MAPRSPHLQPSGGAGRSGREDPGPPRSLLPPRMRAPAALGPWGHFPALRSSDASLLRYRERAGLYSPTQQLPFGRHLRAPRRERTRRFIVSLPGGLALMALANQRGGARELMLWFSQWLHGSSGCWRRCGWPSCGGLQHGGEGVQGRSRHSVVFAPLCSPLPRGDEVCLRPFSTDSHSLLRCGPDQVSCASRRLFPPWVCWGAGLGSTERLGPQGLGLRVRSEVSQGSCTSHLLSSFPWAFSSPNLLPTSYHQGRATKNNFFLVVRLSSGEKRGIYISSICRFR